MARLLKEPIIFLGFPRSGTTIISEPILQHHKLAWVSNYQQKFPGISSINLLRNIFDNRFWKIRGKKKQLNKIPFLNNYIFKPAEAYKFWDRLTGKDFSHSFLFKEEASESDIKRIRSYFEKLVRYQNRERLAFKITGPSRLFYLHSIFPKASFIYIKRNPLPTLRSLLNVHFWRKQREKELWWKSKGVYTSDEERLIQKWKQSKPAFISALQYNKVHEIYSTEKKKLGMENQILEIGYKEFVKNPKPIIDNILEFTGLKWDRNIQNYLAENKIYDRNKCEKYFIGPEMDAKVLEIINDG